MGRERSEVEERVADGDQRHAAGVAEPEGPCLEKRRPGLGGLGLGRGKNRRALFFTAAATDSVHGSGSGPSGELEAGAGVVEALEERALRHETQGVEEAD